ncbi:unnamed protein product, partial [Meganyctiphanes norvegica]
MEDLTLFSHKASLLSKRGQAHRLRSRSTYRSWDQDYPGGQEQRSCASARLSCSYKCLYYSPDIRDSHIYNLKMKRPISDCTDKSSILHQHKPYQQMTTICSHNSSSGYQQQQQSSTERHVVTSCSHSWYLLPLLLLMLLPDVDGGRRLNLIGVGSSPGPDTTTLLGPYEDKTVYPDPSAMFSQPNNTDIRTQVGATAVLHCHPKNVGENT